MRLVNPKAVNPMIARIMTNIQGRTPDTVFKNVVCAQVAIICLSRLRYPDLLGGNERRFLLSIISVTICSL